LNENATSYEGEALLTSISEQKYHDYIKCMEWLENRNKFTVECLWSMSNVRLLLWVYFCEFVIDWTGNSNSAVKKEINKERKKERKKEDLRK
jgi:hypothetical protein